jgi:hypothetical protein
LRGQRGGGENLGQQWIGIEGDGFLGHRAQYSLILHQRPFAVRIVFLHRPRNPGSLFAKIALINFAVLIDDKSHDARLVPMLRISHQRESPVKLPWLR